MWPILLKKVHPMQLFTALFGACVRSKVSEKCFHVQKPKSGSLERDGSI